MFEDYLAGFFDGEGSIIIRFKKDERYRAGYQIEPKINISQKHKGVLKIIQRKLGYGKIYYHKRDKLWHYNVQRFKDIRSFVSLIRGRVIVKKDRLKRFESCLDTLSKKHVTKNNIIQIMRFWNAPETEVNSP